MSVRGVLKHVPTAWWERGSCGLIHVHFCTSVAVQLRMTSQSVRLLRSELVNNGVNSETYAVWNESVTSSFAGLRNHFYWQRTRFLMAELKSQYSVLEWYKLLYLKSRFNFLISSIIFYSHSIHQWDLLQWHTFLETQPVWVLNTVIDFTVYHIHRYTVND